MVCSRLSDRGGLLPSMLGFAKLRVAVLSKVWTYKHGLYFEPYSEKLF